MIEIFSVRSISITSQFFFESGSSTYPISRIHNPRNVLQTGLFPVSHQCKFESFFLDPVSNLLLCCFDYSHPDGMIWVSWHCGLLLLLRIRILILILRCGSVLFRRVSDGKVTVAIGEKEDYNNILRT